MYKLLIIRYKCINCILTELLLHILVSIEDIILNWCQRDPDLIMDSWLQYLYVVNLQGLSVLCQLFKYSSGSCEVQWSIIISLQSTYCGAILYLHLEHILYLHQRNFCSITRWKITMTPVTGGLDPHLSAYFQTSTYLHH